MANASEAEKVTPIIPMSKGDIVRVLALGAGVGLLIWGLGLLLNRYAFDVYLCQGGAGDQCANAKNYAVLSASIVGGIVALVGLIRLRVFRPLLVLIASLLSTWGIVQLSWDLAQFTGLLVVLALYALAFGVFSWISRIRQFWIALVLIILLVTAVRLALTL